LNDQMNSFDLDINICIYLFLKNQNPFE